jgi:Kinesin motor domain
MNLILIGNERRTSSPTEANATSSRSHAVLQINVTVKNKTGDVSEEAHQATLSIIDLAGSERASVTKNRGARLFEGANINKSLLGISSKSPSLISALGNCINALCDSNRRGHIPYRDSKLTRLLKFSLGGNCKTVMIVCISPSSAHYDETHNTLKYGNRAKEIKTKVSRNTLNIDRHVSQYVKLIYELRQEVAELKGKAKAQTGEAEEGFKKGLERYKKLTDEAISQVRQGQERARSNIEEMGNLRALISAFENAKKIVESWIRRYREVMVDVNTGGWKLPTSFVEDAEQKKIDADDLLKSLTERHRNYVQQLMFLQGGEGNIFEQSCKSALKMLDNNGVDEFYIDFVKAEIRACKATMERDAAILQGLKMEEDTSHYVASLTNWMDVNFNSFSELASKSVWTTDEDPELSASVQTLWDFNSKLFRFKAAKCLGQNESPTRPFLATATTMLTPSRKARFLAQFEGSPVRASPRRSPRKFKVTTPKRAVGTKRKTPKKEKKNVRWTEDPPQEFQFQNLTPMPSPVAPLGDGPQETSEGEDSFTMPPPPLPITLTATRPILPLPLRKTRSTTFGTGGILKNSGVSSVPQFVTEFGALQDDSFISNSSSIITNDSPLSELPSGNTLLRSRASRGDLSSNDAGALRGTKRRGTITASPGRAKRVFSAGSLGSGIGNKENNGHMRRASDSPVKSSGVGGRRMTLGGSASRVTNPGWGSMGPPPAAPASSRKESLKGSGGKRGWK